MIIRPTVLILGAGASKPYGFPAGRELLLEIVHRLIPGSTFAIELHTVHGFSDKKTERFRQELSGSYQPSVDSFLEKRQVYLELGKTAIAMRLIPRETAADLERGELQWYEYLIGKLDVSVKGFAKNALSIITFNYDRSFEHHLHRALQDTIGLSPNGALDLLREMSIVHVHGQLGEFSMSTGGQDRAYGAGKDVPDIEIAKDGIIVLHEAEKSSPEFVEARELLDAAEVICFLGFGFLEDNLSRLGVRELAKEKAPRGAAHFFGSAYDLGTAEKAQVTEYLGDTIRLGHDHEDALKFLRNHVVLLQPRG